MVDKPKKNSNPLATDDESLGDSRKRNSRERIYDYIMRGGGESFGEPYDVGIQSLTEKVVMYFQQRGFFGFETLEKPKSQKRVNKFTRYGAARFRGDYKIKRKPK